MLLGFAATTGISSSTSDSSLSTSNRLAGARFGGSSAGRADGRSLSSLLDLDLAIATCDERCSGGGDSLRFSRWRIWGEAGFWKAEGRAFGRELG